MWDRLVDGSGDAWGSQQKGCPAQPCFGDTERGCVPAETPCLEDPRGRGWFLCSPPPSPAPPPFPPFEPCECREEWSDPSNPWCSTPQRGCATPACDLTPPWCVPVKTPCLQDPHGQGSYVCAPSPSPPPLSPPPPPPVAVPLSVPPSPHDHAVRSAQRRLHIALEENSLRLARTELSANREERRGAALGSLLRFMTKYRASLSEQQAALRAKNAKLRAELAERGIRPNAATGSYHDDGGRVAAPQLKISPSPLHWYDAVFDVQALSDVLHGGWSLRLSPALRHAPPSVLRGLRAAAYDGLRKDGAGPRLDPFTAGAPAAAAGAPAAAAVDDASDPFRGASIVVGVLGLYNTGKTFVLNKLTGLALPSSKRVATRGLSLRRATLERTSTDVTLIDSEGSLAPAPISKLRERQATEHFLEEMTAKLGDYLLYMVDDFTSFDQRAIHRLSRKVSEAAASKPAHSRGWSELIVVHNLRTVADESTLWHQWRMQVIGLHGDGAVQTTRVALPRPGGALEQRDVKWFHTHPVRHVVLASQGSPLGEAHNAATFALLRQWLVTAVVPHAPRENMIARLLRVGEEALRAWTQQPLRLVLERSADPTILFVRSCDDAADHRDGPGGRVWKDDAVAGEGSGGGGGAGGAGGALGDPLGDGFGGLAAADATSSQTGIVRRHASGGLFDPLAAAARLHATSSSVTPPKGGSPWAGQGSPRAGQGSPHGLGSHSISRASPRRYSGRSSGRSSAGASPGSTGSVPRPAPFALQLTQHNSWLPRVDLCEGADEYIVAVDVPALRAADLSLTRAGAFTRIRGQRSVPYALAGRSNSGSGDSVGVSAVLRAERRYGIFELVLRVPDAYHPRWSACDVADGVLRVRYKRDEDELEVVEWGDDD